MSQLKHLIMSFLILGFWTVLGSARGSEVESEMYLNLAEGTDRKENGMALGISVGAELSNPYYRQQVYRVVFESLESGVVFFQFDVSMYQTQKSNYFLVSEASLAERNLKIKSNIADFSFGTQIGFCPLQSLSNLWFFKKVVPMDFRLSLGTGMQMFKNNNPSLYLNGKFDLVVPVSKNIDLGLSYRNTILNIAQTDWESRNDLELATMWRF